MDAVRRLRQGIVALSGGGADERITVQESYAKVRADSDI
jgi:hypothetical protein